MAVVGTGPVPRRPGWHQTLIVRQRCLLRLIHLRTCTAPRPFEDVLMMNGLPPVMREISRPCLTLSAVQSKCVTLSMKPRTLRMPT